MSDFWVIDAHQHVGSLAETGVIAPVDAGSSDEVFVWTADEELHERTEILERRGVDQAVVIGGHGYLRPNGLADTRRVNDHLAAYRDRRSDLFPAAIGIVEPLYGARGFDELQRCVEELNMKGISFHTRFQGVSLDSPWVHRYVERMGHLGLVPFIHAMGESVDEHLWKVDILAADFPDLTMVVLDAFSTYDQCALLLHVAERRTNLLFETAISRSFTYCLPLVREFGAERLIYGTDLYSGPRSVEQPDMLPELVASELSTAEKAAIAGGNIHRVLGLKR